MGIQNLYFNIIEFEGDTIFDDLLKKWISQNNYNLHLAELSNKILPDKHLLSQEDIWELYALSRVLDVLTLRFQPNKNADGSDWLGPNVTISEYISFCELIGLKVSTPQKFHNFSCEIIDAEQGENNFEIKEFYFPTVMLKNLMIKKAGLKILMNDTDFDLNLINNTTIYWAFRRKNRPYNDLSIGWGSNLQWRTDFRLDIETAENYIYNYDGKINLNHLPNLADDDLSISEAIELTKTRHFIYSKKEGSDLFPYDYRYDEKKTIIDSKSF